MALTREIVLDPILPKEEQEKLFHFLKNVIKDGKRSSCVIYGPANSGKSTLTRVAQQVVGSENCVFVPDDIQQLLPNNHFRARMKDKKLGIITQDWDNASTIKSIIIQQKNERLPKHMLIIRMEECGDIDRDIDRDCVIIHCSLTLKNISRNILHQIYEPQLTLIQEIRSLIEKIE
uniref:AAA ATPase domain protein n=1 Tax=Marseillevirus LCMAC101 TaxID=2506602 RepID=A0A481YR28_9VIRU|nr:MAG: AAA ATPase domain protein [Marseillevirus LCMAC101]